MPFLEMWKLSCVYRAWCFCKEVHTNPLAQDAGRFFDIMLALNCASPPLLLAALDEWEADGKENLGRFLTSTPAAKQIVDQMSLTVKMQSVCCITEVMKHKDQLQFMPWSAFCAVHAFFFLCTTTQEDSYKDVLDVLFD